MTLRIYQTEAVEGVSRALKVHRRVLLQAPTGAGKTMTASHMIQSCVARGWQVMFMCHRDELVQQTSKTLQRMGIDHGFVAAGYPKDMRHKVLVCMVGTVGKRLDKLPTPNIIFTDEAHHAVAGTWKKIIDSFPSALIVGLSATPERLDGRGLDDIFGALVPGPAVRWLMDEGYLSDYRAWSHAPPDLSSMKRRGADYDPAALAEKMTDAHLVGDAVDHYMRICPGERAVSFCVNVEHANAVRDAFTAAGVTSASLFGESPKEERRRVLAAFRAGDISVLTSVDLFGEGFDLPEVSVAILQRPTESLALYLQQVGRVLRPVYAQGYPLNTREERLAAIAIGPKTCLARGTKVLTPRGLVTIEDVQLSDRVWDGENWVNHEGAVCNGRRKVITYAGVTLTPDHLLFTQEGWKEAGECARKQIPVAQTGLGGCAVRLSDNLFAGGEVGRQAAEPQAARLHAMRHVLARAVDVVLEFAARAHRWMSGLQPASSVSHVALQSNAVGHAALQQSEPSLLPQLRRTRDHVRLFLPSGDGLVGAGTSWSSRVPEVGGDRPDRKRSWLRTRKSPVVDSRSEPSSRATGPVVTRNAPFSPGVPGCSIRGSDAAQVSAERHDIRGDSSSLSPRVFVEAEREVWDLVNSGPLHRFTANGVLVHNCAVILDHAGNISRHGLPDDHREWTLEGRKKGSAKSGGPGAKVCATCFGSNPQGTKICRYCNVVFILTPREIEQIEGELKEIDRERARTATASQPARDARSYEEIVTIFIARGNGDPAAAAENVWRSMGNSISDGEYIAACTRVEKERGYKKGWAYFRARLRNTRNMSRKRAMA